MALNVTTKDKNTSSSPLLAPVEQPCRYFSMAELSSATDSFDEKWCIGQGGFGKVYKGKFSDGPGNTYAVKRSHFMSDQGEPEFWAEVEMLSRLRHCNLVSLIGYCNEGKDMALVYDYMSNGTLSDHLHKKRTHFTWSQRLKICLGAARGLDYLHTGTGTQQGVIHRDVKSSNILLDQNYAAKIADFGLAKMVPINQTHTHVSTKVKGTFGYMDPNYFHTGRLTRKSDVYAFGVVLIEVLSGRPAVDKSLDQGLAIWAQDLIKQGRVTQIISSSLRDHISKSCLKEFSRIAIRCLSSYPNQRPTMTEVVGSLDRALSFQERKASSAQGRITLNNVWSLLTLKGPFELRSTGAAEGKEINCNTVVSENVGVDQREDLEGQDENQSKSSLVNASYLIPLINKPSSASTSAPVETVTEIKESIQISNGGDGYSDEVPSQEEDNKVSDTRNPANDSGNNAADQVDAEWIETFEPGVYVTLKALRDGTRDLKRVRFSRRRFSEHEAERWWVDNRGEVYKRYNILYKTNAAVGEGKEISCNTVISENVIVTDVGVDQREALEGQDENQSKSNLGNTSLLISQINKPSSASTSALVEAVTEIKESIHISNRDDGYSDSNFINGCGGSVVELENKCMPDDVHSQDGENKASDARNPANDSGNNAVDQVDAEWIETFEPGVYVTLKALRDGTRDVNRVRFSRRRFGELEAERWWLDNREEVYRRYNVRMPTMSNNVRMPMISSPAGLRWMGFPLISGSHSGVRSKVQSIPHVVLIKSLLSPHVLHDISQQST